MFAYHNPHSPKFVRFGLQFPDGSKVTNVAASPDWWDEDAAQPDGPVLIGDPEADGWNSDATAVDLDYWLWPLPSDSSVRVVVEWPAEGIAETSLELDITPLLAASAIDTRF